MRNKYGREKRKWKVANKSGAGAGAGAKDDDVHAQKILKILNWLDPYFVDGDTSTNFESFQSIELDNEDDDEDNDDFDNHSIDSEDLNMSTIVTNESSTVELNTTLQKNKGKKTSSTTPNDPSRKSAVTGRLPFKRHKKEEPDMDADLMLKLKEKLGTKKDEDQLYGKLLAAKLRKLTKLSKLKAKHEIDNLVFKYEI